MEPNGGRVQVEEFPCLGNETADDGWSKRNYLCPILE